MDIRDPSPPPNEGEYLIAQEETTHQETETIIPAQTQAQVPKPSVSGTGVVESISTDDQRIRGTDRAPIPPITTTAPGEEELQRRLSEALAEITRLQGLIAAQPVAPAATGIRRRTTRVISEDNGSTIAGADEASDDGTLVESISAPEGVPVQVVAIIAVGVFIATYLFF